MKRKALWVLGPSPTGAPCSRGWAHQCYSLEGLPGRTDESLNFVLKAGRSHGRALKKRRDWPGQLRFRILCWP